MSAPAGWWRKFWLGPPTTWFSVKWRLRWLTREYPRHMLWRLRMMPFEYRHRLGRGAAR